MELYFGGEARSLYGVWHEPPRPPAPPRVLVLCAPLWREGVRAHRVLRQLAARLAREGTTVLRFDYTGAGDSAGDNEAGDVETWLGDVDAAVEEARGARGAARVTLLGLRFGATLAALAAARRDDVDRLVLWEPVPDGTSYLAEGRAEHRAWADLYAAWRRLPRRQVEDPGDEILGYRVTAAMRASISMVDLATLSRTARDVLVIERAAPDPGGGLPAVLAARGARVLHEVLAEPEIWKPHHAEGTAGARRTQDLIAGWLARSAS
ncbi:MAG TPA: alpha/beta hydrolase [Polyangia bacterium]|nr:alpha/beta hydrolase [Polyangia bacterium]